MEKNIQEVYAYWSMVFSKAIRLLVGEMRGIALGVVSVLVLACISTIAYFFNLSSTRWVDQTWDQAFLGLASACITGGLLLLAFLFVLAYIAARIHSEQEDNKRKLRKEIEELQERNLPTSAKMEVRKLVSPRIPPHKRVGIIIKNNEFKDLTDIRIRLLKATDWEFSDETAYMEDSEWDIAENNCYFDLGTNSKVGAENEEPFYFAEIQGEQVFFLLDKKPRPLKYRYPHIETGLKSHFVKCEIEFEIHGNISGVSFRKERYFAVIDSYRLVSISDATLNNSISINMRKEIIRIH